ncbi:hypothetical protein AURDEDRAFT_171583 [Auricularia subglabra TFB-10046 SS5]|nr:hypothetical protein AURDEDRAFT_171583 [Auricularia subglabra TFB-10046 SS5]
MLVVENPDSLDGSVKFSSFVLITVDIAASLRGVTDEVAIQAAEALPRAKCLAWINSYTSRFGSSLFYVLFMLADRHLPAAPRSFAAVPIAPNAPHPETGRAAAVPSRPFPWPDCYLHTLRDFTAPISRLYQSSEPGILLDDSQTEHVLIAAMDDVDATEEERQAALFAAGYGVPSGVRIRDHGSYGSVIEGESASGSEASSRRSLPEDPEDLHPEPDASVDDSPSRPSSVHLSVEDQPAVGEPEQGVQDTRIVIQVEVTGILDPSDELGTVENFVSVVERLRGIEAERAERAVTSRLARAAVSKTAAWLQGVPAGGELEDEGPAHVPEQRPSQDRPPGASPGLSTARVEPAGSSEQPEKKQRAAHPRDEASELRSPSPARSPAAVQAQINVAAAIPSQQRPPEVHEAVRPPSPSTGEPKDLEAGERTRSASAPPAKPDAERSSPRPWTLRTWLSLVLSRIRALIARWRAFF